MSDATKADLVKAMEAHYASVAPEGEAAMLLDWVVVMVGKGPEDFDSKRSFYHVESPDTSMFHQNLGLLETGITILEDEDEA